MSKKFPEYSGLAHIRQVMLDTRNHMQLSMPDVAAALSDDTGYHVTSDQYRAVEQGITKNVPVWLVAAFMDAYGIDPRVMFPGWDSAASTA